MDVDEGGIRLAMLASMGAMLGVALAVPGAFGNDGRCSAARLVRASGLERARLARDSYTYLHPPMVAGIVLFALGLKTTLGDVGEELDTVPAVGLCGGAALYLLAHVAFLFRATGYVFRRRTVGAAVLLALIPAAVALPALAALALVSAVCTLVVVYEAIRHRGPRLKVRYPELAARREGEAAP
jgi:low temperature requirement protein LtrA